MQRRHIEREDKVIGMVSHHPLGFHMAARHRRRRGGGSVRDDAPRLALLRTNKPTRQQTKSPQKKQTTLARGRSSSPLRNFAALAPVLTASSKRESVRASVRLSKQSINRCVVYQPQQQQQADAKEKKREPEASVQKKDRRNNTSQQVNQFSRPQAQSVPLSSRRSQSVRTSRRPLALFVVPTSK